MFNNNRSMGTEQDAEKLAFEVYLEQVTPFMIKLCRETQIYGLEQDDLFQELSIQLYICWERYDPSQGTKFLTFAYPALTRRKNELVRQRKAVFRGSGVAPIPLDGDRSFKADPRFHPCLFDVIAEPSVMTDESIIARMDILDATEDAIRSFKSKKVQKILVSLLMGHTQKEVSAKYGCAQSLVSQYLNQFRRLLRERLKDYRCVCG